MLNIDNTKRVGKIIDIDQVKLDPEQISGLINVDVEGFFAQAIYVESNALSVGRMFNLPDLDGVDRFVQENHPEMRMIA